MKRKVVDFAQTSRRERRCVTHAITLRTTFATKQAPKRDESPIVTTGLFVMAARSPEQIRTAVTALRGRRPGPLDDGAVVVL
jgi:hypothetical protein